MPEIGWAELEGAFGSAAAVPERLRAIVAGGEGAADALVDLSECLHHQGGLYPATDPAIPHLVAALRATAAGPDVRRGLLWLLGGIAEAATDATAVAHERQLDRLDAIVDAVWAGADAYVARLADDPDADVRVAAAYALGCLLAAPSAPPADVERVRRALDGRLDAERDDLARSSAVFALRHAGVDDALRALVADPAAGPRTRVAAALVLAEADPAGEDAAVAILARTLEALPDADGLFQPPGAGGPRDLPWVRGNLRYRLVPVVCAWSAADPGRTARVAPALAAAVRAATHWSVARDVLPILAWAGGLPGPARDAILRACAGNAGIWTGRLEAALAGLGLPDTRAALGELVGG